MNTQGAFATGGLMPRQEALVEIKSGAEDVHRSPAESHELAKAKEYAGDIQFFISEYKEWMTRSEQQASQIAKLQLDLWEQLHKVEALRSALIWMSGSDDFAVGGKARYGFERHVLPLLADSVDAVVVEERPNLPVDPSAKAPYLREFRPGYWERVYTPNWPMPPGPERPNIIMRRYT